MGASSSITQQDRANAEAARTPQDARSTQRRKIRRTRRLFEAYRKRGDVEARDLIHQEHLHLAERYARKHSGRGAEYDDLLQEANLGLMRAIERYDPARGTTFSTYASCMIEGSIKQYFRDRTWPCAVPRKVKGLALQVRNMERTLGRTPTYQEVVESGVIPEDQVVAALIASHAWSTVCLSQVDAAVAESKIRRALSYTDPKYELASNLIDMKAAMQKLDDEEMKVALMYYFGHCSQKKIAQSMDVSPMHVSRLLRKATRKLGREFSSMYRAS